MNIAKGSFSFILSLLLAANVSATTYYFNAASGNDQNAGKSPEMPFKTFSVIRLLKLQPGDSLLLSNDKVFTETFELHSVSGSRANPVVVTTYGTGERKAKINARNFLNGMLLDNCSFESPPKSLSRQF